MLGENTATFRKLNARSIFVGRQPVNKITADINRFRRGCSDKIPGSKYQWVRIPADKIPRTKYRGQNTAVQNTAGHNTSVKIPVVIIPYWTKYHTGQNTILDKIPYWT